MDFLFTHEVDSANKILICEAKGVLKHAIELEHIIKEIVKLAGKNQLISVVFDVTELNVQCSSIEISNILIDVRDLDLLADIKIARVTTGEQNSQNMIGEISERLSLSIKNFETRSEAFLWLLFDKLPKREK